MATDQDWAEVARGAREALASLGYPVDTGCLPDEERPCGGTFAQHAAACFITIKAVVDHQIQHIGPEFVAPIHGPIYLEAMTRLEAGCQLEGPRAHG